MISTATTLLVLTLGIGAPARNARPSAATPAVEGAAPAASLSQVEVNGRVDAYLRSIDTPIGAERWRALGPAAVAPLEAIANDADAFPSRRAKAVAALSAIGGARAQKVILGRLRAEGDEYAVRASAARAAGHFLSASAAAKELRPILQRASDPRLRATAAEVLARKAPRSACGDIRTQVAREKESAKASYGKALESCGEE